MTGATRRTVDRILDAMLDAFPSQGRDLGLRGYEGRVDDLSPAGPTPRGAARRPPPPPAGPPTPPPPWPSWPAWPPPTSRRPPTATTWPWSWPRRSCCWPGASRPAGTPWGAGGG